MAVLPAAAAHAAVRAAVVAVNPFAMPAVDAAARVSNGSNLPAVASPVPPLRTPLVLTLAAVYLRRVRVVGSIFVAGAPPLTHVWAVLTLPAPAAQNSAWAFGGLVGGSCVAACLRQWRAFERPQRHRALVIRHFHKHILNIKRIGLAGTTTTHQKHDFLIA
jgi:hypothetical protein